MLVVQTEHRATPYWYIGTCNLLLLRSVLKVAVAAVSTATTICCHNRQQRWLRQVNATNTTNTNKRGHTLVNGRLCHPKVQSLTVYCLYLFIPSPSGIWERRTYQKHMHCEETHCTKSKGELGASELENRRRTLARQTTVRNDSRNITKS